jgi:hypothetical protein
MRAGCVNTQRACVLVKALVLQQAPPHQTRPVASTRSPTCSIKDSINARAVTARSAPCCPLPSFLEPALLHSLLTICLHMCLIPSLSFPATRHLGFRCSCTRVCDLSKGACPRALPRACFNEYSRARAQHDHFYRYMPNLKACPGLPCASPRAYCPTDRHRRS